MKQAFCFVLLALLLAGLCGCGGESPAAVTEESAAVYQASAAPAPSAVYTTQEAETSNRPDVLSILTGAKTSQYVKEQPVPEDDLDTILRAGLNAPSAMNYQPWHFSVVTDTNLLKDLGDEVLKVREYKRLERFNLWNTSVAIIISQTNNLTTDSFDCGLACEAMSITAQYLGYGTKILAHPNLVLNGDKQDEYRTVFAIPDDHTAIAILIIGVPEKTVDAVSAASTRRTMEESVSFVKAG